MPEARAEDGARLHYEELAGDGPPVLLLHGVLDTPTVWMPVARRLHRAGRRVLVLHERAHGASEPWAPGLDWSPDASARDALALLRHAAPEGAHLAGHSRGATAAGWVAVEEPTLARSLAVVASPPQATEVFRAFFRRRLPDAQDEREREALTYLAAIPDEAFPSYALRRYRGRALVVEPEDDPLYSPTSTLFWRAFLPYADFERIAGGHRFFAADGPDADWLARRLLAHVEAAEQV